MHLREVTFVDLNAVQVICFLKEESLLLIMAIFQNFDSLSEIAVDVLNSPFALPVVHCYLDANLLVWVVQNLFDVNLDLHIVVRQEAAEAALALHVALQLKPLAGEAFDGLVFDFI